MRMKTFNINVDDAFKLLEEEFVQIHKKKHQSNHMFLYATIEHLKQQIHPLLYLISNKFS